jgi:hypothetical protein
MVMAKITFNSQEEFENAVMEVLNKRLRVNLNTFEEFGDQMLEITLSDRINDKEYFMFEWSTTCIEKID